MTRRKRYICSHRPTVYCMRCWGAGFYYKEEPETTQQTPSPTATIEQPPPKPKVTDDDLE